MYIITLYMHSFGYQNKLTCIQQCGKHLIINLDKSTYVLVYLCSLYPCWVNIRSQKVRLYFANLQCVSIFNILCEQGRMKQSYWLVMQSLKTTIAKLTCDEDTIVQPFAQCCLAVQIHNIFLYIKWHIAENEVRQKGSEEYAYTITDGFIFLEMDNGFRFQLNILY